LVGTGDAEWLEVDEETATVELASYLTELITVAQPILIARSKEDSLASYWLTGASDGLTEPQRLMNLAVVLSKLERYEDCKAVIDELERKSVDKPWRPLARTIIAQLSERNGD
jgi:predicted P-loop ATPase/GTPase